jgi:uncharacterized oxidoreductase
LAFVDWLKQSPAALGSTGVQIAGEPELETRVLRKAHGIRVDSVTWNEILAAEQKAESAKAARA